MTSEALFGLSVLMSFLAFGIVTKLYIWPRLRVMPRRDSLMALVVPHTFRFVGLSFLVPGVVSATLPSAFAVPAAYGDLVAAVLAAIATWALYARGLGHRIGVAVQRVGVSRPPQCNLRRPDRGWNWPRLARSCILYSNPNRAAAANYARPNILASLATDAVLRAPIVDALNGIGDVRP